MRLGWPQGRSGLVRKFSPPPTAPGTRSRTVQPVASRYTDWAIPALGPVTNHTATSLSCPEEEVAYFIRTMWFEEIFCSTELAEGITITGHSEISTLLLQISYTVWFEQHLSFVTLVLLHFPAVPSGAERCRAEPSGVFNSRTAANISLSSGSEPEGRSCTVSCFRRENV